MKKRKRIFFITSVVVASVVILGTIFAIIDYNKAMDGKKPMFASQNLSFQSFDVEVVGEEETKDDNNYDYIVYSGLGYNIVVCDECKKPVDFMLFGIGDYPFSVLACTQEISYNDKHIFQYTFADGKLDSISTTNIIPEKDIVDEASYQAEIIKINDIKGCFGELTKNINLSGEVTYKTNQACDLDRMTDEDIKTVYKTDRGSLEQTKEEIIKSHNDDEPATKCGEDYK